MLANGEEEQEEEQDALHRRLLQKLKQLWAVPVQAWKEKWE